MKKAHLEGPADLAVEVILPESFSRDRGEKLHEYESAGIPEYWLIDPDRELAEFYQLDARERYQLIAADEHGIYRSRMLQGLWLRVAWLWQDPLPETEETLLEIASASGGRGCKGTSTPPLPLRSPPALLLQRRFLRHVRFPQGKREHRVVLHPASLV